MTCKQCYMALAVVATALIAVVGCGKQKPVSEQENVQYLYSEQSYVQAQQQIKQSVKDTLAGQGAKLEDLFIEWGPVSWEPPRLIAQVDAYSNPKAGQAVSKVVADACLTALPKHDQVAVTVYWWGELDAAQEILGKWVWNKSGELVEYKPLD